METLGDKRYEHVGYVNFWKNKEGFCFLGVP